MHKIFNYNENNIINKTALIAVFYNNFHFTGIISKDYSHINCFIPTVYEGNKIQFDTNIFFEWIKFSFFNWLFFSFFLCINYLCIFFCIKFNNLTLKHEGKISILIFINFREILDEHGPVGPDLK